MLLSFLRISHEIYFDLGIKNGQVGMNKTILLYTENLDDNATLIRKVLAARGYEVLWANTFEKALDMVAVYPPGLILIDVIIPDGDGKSLIDRFRNIPKFNKVPLIRTVTSSEELRDFAKKDDGCDGYIYNPVNIQQLSETINHFLKPT
jgi:DNA-binding response OmpR family regulator